MEGVGIQSNSRIDSCPHSARTVSAEIKDGLVGDVCWKAVLCVFAPLREKYSCAKGTICAKQTVKEHLYMTKSPDTVRMDH